MRSDVAEQVGGVAFVEFGKSNLGPGLEGAEIRSVPSTGFDKSLLTSNNVPKESVDRVGHEKQIDDLSFHVCPSNLC